MIDYAQPAMNAEHAMKELHWSAIEGKLDEAIEHGLKALTEVRLTITALKHMKEKQNAIREQATSLQT